MSGKASPKPGKSQGSPKPAGRGKPSAAAAKASGPERIWIAVTATVDAAHEEPAGERLRSAWKGGLLVAPAGRGRVALTLYMPAEACTEDALARIAAKLSDLGNYFPGFAFDLSTAETPEENWAEAWKIHFKPLRLGRRVLVAPSWEKVERKAGDLVLRLDPGCAFGTGLHETTRLCVEALERLVRAGDRVLDVGTGTGILAIVAAKLGATVVATDIDPYAVGIASRNARKNRTGARVRAARADLLSASPEEGDPLGIVSGGKFDLVVANILLPEVLRLLPPVGAVLRPGGLLLLSGILAEQLAEVKKGLQRNGFEPLEPHQAGEWALAVGKLREGR